MNLGMDFDGQSVIVTGGATGIGEACCHLFAQSGADVTVMDINREGAERVANDVTGKGGKAEVSIVDLTDFDATTKAIDAVNARAGKIDVMVHSAGGFPRYINLMDCPVDTWDGVVDSNLKSLFYLLKAATPHMIEKEYGRIVALSSMAVRGARIVSGPHYAAAKAGEIGLIQQAARALGPHGITANIVAPGAVRTPRTNAMRTPEAEKRIQESTPVRRLSQPEEIAWPIVFLCSAESSYITGATLDVNGGDVMV
ncbi:MAG: SDR family oxidoreductase [Rhizobiales bacterium]|nr:SDR family oxidoreductase [Hyphomicrobiales bacterium]